MAKKLFEDLVTNLKEAAAITKGKARPARQFEVARSAAPKAAHR